MGENHAMQLALYEPEIPPNTGNVARLCAATGTVLNLIEPLGFSLDDKHLKRAGLDYWEHVRLKIWPDWEAFAKRPPGRIVLSSARRGVRYDRFAFEAEDVIVLGPETRGLPEKLMAAQPHLVRLPIRGEVRSLNMSTAAGILLYEGLRRTAGFPENSAE